MQGAVILGVCALVLGGLVGGGLTGHFYELKLQEKEIERAAAVARAKDVDAKAGKRLSEQLAKQTSEVKVVEKILTKIIERPVYRNVCVDDDGIKALNDLIGN